MDEQTPDDMPIQVPLERDATLREFLNTALSAALEDKHLRVTGHCLRGGCVLRWTLSIDGVDYATAFHSNAETKH